ncbi:hypothetical protein OEZ85_010983 [Tetradesmus obliquus]|uniref:Uncharacterized protein n=1 Tax=Tetradesmus obliquus TaxID=3088 RepID=A0ABY8TP54_TETOB|nr:hypothetical protein OEZ85_010983 [Tetradesmus obliquus]
MALSQTPRVVISLSAGSAASNNTPEAEANNNATSSDAAAAADSSSPPAPLKAVRLTAGRVEKLVTSLERIAGVLSSLGAETREVNRAIKILLKPSTTTTAQVRKQSPSAYNLFVKHTMPLVKAEKPDATAKERMQMCAALWKESKLQQQQQQQQQGGGGGAPESYNGSSTTNNKEPAYLMFAITNAPVCFWDAVKELNDTLLEAGMTGHQILINQGCFLKMHGAHVQVRLSRATDLEKLLFLQPKSPPNTKWADDEEEPPCLY